MTVSMSSVPTRTGPRAASQQAANRHSVSQGLEDMGAGLLRLDDLGEEGDAADVTNAAIGSPELLDADAVRLRHDLQLT